MNAATAEVQTNANNLELNQGDDFIIAMDVSGSMANTDCPGGLTRFQFALEKAKLFAHEAAKIDTDGVSVYRFGHQVTKFSDITEDKLDSAIASVPPNESATLTHEVIAAAYQEHIERKNEQTFLFIITDGAPTDPMAVFSTIADITKKIKDEKEFRIQFLIVGSVDSALQNFLTKLDDSIPGAKYDIVDVKNLADVTFMAAVAGALND